MQITSLAKKTLETLCVYSESCQRSILCTSAEASEFAEVYVAKHRPTVSYVDQKICCFTSDGHIDCCWYCLGNTANLKTFAEDITND